MGQGSEVASGSGSEGGRAAPVDYAALASKTGQAHNERVRQLAGRALVHRAVSDQLAGHVYRSVRDGTLPPAAGTLIRLFYAETVTLEVDAGLAIAGTAGVVGAEGDGLEIGLRYLARQTVCSSRLPDRAADFHFGDAVPVEAEFSRYTASFEPLPQPEVERCGGNGQPSVG
jgi:hypothetical protein